jgi:hypothetical protein
MSAEINLDDRGNNVKAYQSSLNDRLHAHRDPAIDEDGHCGPQTIEQSAYAAWFLGALDATIDKIKGGVIPVGAQAIIQDPSKRDGGQLKRARERREQHFGDLGTRALKVAAGLVGVMEEGGNNTGKMVLKIIRANGGTGPEAWCGDFVAYCYRQAGSVGVERLWCSVSQVSKDPDVHKVTQPKPGDLVRFTFDHIGLFVRNVGSSQIETIEGNTGRNGAVSDSKTGGDGVYRKRRAKKLVADYLRVER